MLEAMAQAGGILVYTTLRFDRSKEMLVYAGVDRVRFKKPVFPGDQMIIEVEALSIKRNLAKLNAVIRVKGEVAATSQIYVALKDIESFKNH
jgi:3-hydroxyacyl-[acyl-carrier-protein] dehydratase